jgi:hypothetical protein
MPAFIKLDPSMIAQEVTDSVRSIMPKGIGNVYKVLSAKDLQSVFSGAIGVGSPFIIRDLDTYQAYMLFTAWSDITGNARQIWVAPISEDLVVDVSKAKKIADGSLFGVTGLNTVHAYWDDYNAQWVLFATFYGGTASNVAGVIFTDQDFNVVGKQTLTFTMVDGTAPNLLDAGVCPVPLYNKRVLLLAGFERYKGIYLLSDGTARPLPTPSQLNASGSTPYGLIPTYYRGSADVHQLLLLNQGLVILCEHTEFRNQWFIQVFYGPEKDWNVGTSWVIPHFVAPIPPPFPMHFTEVVGNIGHPHYTNYLKEPLLFFIRSPTWNFGGRRAWAHDIWAMRIDPDYVFNPRGKVLVASETTSIYSLVSTMPIPTFGARRAIIYLFGVSASGTLTVTESTGPYHIRAQTGTIYQTTYSVNSGANKIVIDNPAPYISLGLNVSLSEWAVFLSPV